MAEANLGIFSESKLVICELSGNVTMSGHDGDTSEEGNNRQGKKERLRTLNRANAAPGFIPTPRQKPCELCPTDNADIPFRPPRCSLLSVAEMS